MAAEEEIRVIMGPEFDRVIIALREVDATLPAQLRKDIRTAVRPLIQRAKARVRAIPTHGLKHTGLRAKVAAGVGLRVALGRNAGVRVTTSMPRADMAAIPRGLDSPRGWRHPVYGNQDNWVRQHSIVPGWFTETMASGAPEIRDDIEQTIDNAAQHIADQGGTPR